MIALVAWLACGGEAPEASWTERWDADPAAALVALAEEPDDLVQLGAFRTLLDHDPAIATRCPELSSDAALEEECRTVSGRPHLWQEEARVPRSLPLDGAVSPWEVGGHACMEEEAARWRHECFFRAAETALSQRRPAEAGPLCLGVEEDADRCLGHLARLAATAAPQDEAGWGQIVEVVAAVRAGLPSPLAQRVADRFWAETTLQSIWQARTTSGAAHAWLPEEAWPHLRAALAVRVVTQRPEAGFEGLVAAARSAWRGQPPERDPARRPYGPVALPAQQAGEPWVAFLRDQRRAVSAVEEVDWKLAVLESAARVRREDVVREARQDGHPGVAERARQLERGRPRP